MGRDDRTQGESGVGAALSQAAHVAAASGLPWLAAPLQALEARNDALERLDRAMSARPESTTEALDALVTWLDSGGTVWQLRVWAAAMYGGALRDVALRP